MTGSYTCNLWEWRTHQEALALLVREILRKRHVALHKGSSLSHPLPALIPEHCTPVRNLPWN